MRVFAPAAAFAVVLASGSLFAQPPTFRTGTTLVEVSAVVTRGGQPVTDLTADEVTVFDNGEPQRVVAFERVDLTTADGPEQRRDFVLVLDDLHVAPSLTQATIDAALVFVDALGPHDRLAVVNTGPHDLSVDLSTDRERARRAIRRFRGQIPNGPLSGLDATRRTRDALDVLKQVATNVRTDAAERRSVLFMSSGLEGLTVDDVKAIAPTDRPEVWLDYLEVLREASLSNVAIYAVDPRGLRVGGVPDASVSSKTVGTGAREVAQTVSANAHSVMSERFGSLAILAQNTGGKQTYWTNDLTAGFPGLIRDSRQYYRIAYEQPMARAGKKQPQTRSITVKVSRPGVDVRARQRYAPVSES